MAGFSHCAVPHCTSCLPTGEPGTQTKRGVTKCRVVLLLINKAPKEKALETSPARRGELALGSCLGAAAALNHLEVSQQILAADLRVQRWD